MAREIHLTRGKVAIVDDEDYEWLAASSWCYKPDKRTGYAIRRGSRSDRTQTIWMHRQILDAPPGVQVDHIDGDGLNNRRANLRFATNTENQRNQRTPRNNSSGFKGVHVHRRNGLYVVTIRIDGATRQLGQYANKVIAARVYDKAARDAFGEFARLNLPDLPMLSDEEIDALRIRNKHLSRYSGVAWKADKRKWRARIKVDGKDVHLGYFATEIDAANAFNQAAFKYGTRSKLNEIGD